MPSSVHRGIAIGEMTRIIRNTTSPVLPTHYSHKLINHFRHRKYPPHIIRKLKTMAHIPREEILNNTTKRNISRPLPFSTKFRKFKPSLNSILRKRWSSIYNDKYLYPLYPNTPFTVHTSHKTLRAILSSKRKEFGGTPTQKKSPTNECQSLYLSKIQSPKTSKWTAQYLPTHINYTPLQLQQL